MLTTAPLPYKRSIEIYFSLLAALDTLSQAKARPRIGLRVSRSKQTNLLPITLTHVDNVHVQAKRDDVDLGPGRRSGSGSAGRIWVAG